MTVDTRFKLRISSSLRLLTINHYIVLTYSRNESNDKYKYQSLIGITKNRLTGETLTKDKRFKAAYSAITKRIGVTDEECHRNIVVSYRRLTLLILIQTHWKLKRKVDK